MSYVVLARKYRPQTFEDLVGQMPVSQTLRNAIESGRISHAYIFSGPRGIGKTTTARVLAKCMNCEKGPSTTPCNKCDSCISISAANSMGDVLEIDGASNRGIEQIRELRENAKYAPAKSRYRIYIIDEAHQITKDAFGALLKTLEEPPSHVVFMMATTEAHKIPSPILSRCQRFTLRPIAPDLVFDHLKSICKKEKVKIEDEAIKNIVRFVDGSLRDALSLLDQAVVYSPKGITSDSLRQLLGLLPMEVIHEFSEVLKEGDPAKILKTITQNIQNGIDLTQLGKDLQNHYHGLLLNKAGVDDPIFVGGEEIKKTVQSYDFITLERNIRLLAKLLEEMRRSETPRALFEIYALRIGQKTLDARVLLERVEALEKGTTNGAVISSTKANVSFSKPNPPATGPMNKAAIGFTAAPTTSRPSAPQPSIATLSPALKANIKSAITTDWDEFIEFVGKSKQMLAAALTESEREISNSHVTIKFEKSFHQQLIDRNMPQLKDLMHDFFGSTMSIETKIAPLMNPPKKISFSPTPPPSYYAQEKSNQANEIQFEELLAKDLGDDVQKAIKHFPGTLKRQVKDS